MFLKYFLTVAIYLEAVCGERLITSLRYSQVRVKPTHIPAQPAKWLQVPYLASIKRQYRKVSNTTTLWTNVCAGIIIGPQKVLTAAHCFERKEFFYVKHPEELTAVAGYLATRLSQTKAAHPDPSTQWRLIVKLVIHENYNFPTNDLGVAFIDPIWNFNADVYFIRIQTKSDDDFVNCVAAGYGRVRNGSRIHGSVSLLISPINVLSRDICTTVFSTDMDAFVCTDTVAGSVVPDENSGIPLVCDEFRKGQTFPVGELLCGVSCGCNVDKTTLFTRVSEHASFIENPNRIVSLKSADDEAQAKGKANSMRKHFMLLIISFTVVRCN